MKKNCNKMFLLIIILFLVSVSVYSQSHTIASIDEIINFTEPGLPMWLEPDINGSLILSWDEQTVGIAGGFCDLTAYLPYPNGGKYEIGLVSVVSASADTIEGVWQVKKNGTVEIVTLGTATNLDTAFGGVITITIGSYVLNARVSFKIDGLFDPLEITGQTLVDGIPVVGAKSRIRGGGAVLDEQTTDSDGGYKYLIDPEDVKRILVIFRNFDPEIVVSGYVFVGGQPLVGATVIIKNQVGDLDTIVTDANGYYESSTIVDAVGAGANNVRVIILNN